MKKPPGHKADPDGSSVLSLAAGPSPDYDRRPGRMPGRDEKLFYKIGEVSVITGLKPYVLRYWETEFPLLHPKKSRGGQRVYLKRDVEAVLRIKRMLYEEGYTIAGARKALGRKGKEAASFDSRSSSEKLLLELRTGLSDILRIVSSYNRGKGSNH